MAWTGVYFQSLPVTSNVILIPHLFTSDAVIFIVNQVPTQPDKYFHSGWLRQVIEITGFPELITRSFQRLPMNSSILLLDNTTPYQLEFKCFTYLGELLIQAYEDL